MFNTITTNDYRGNNRTIIFNTRLRSDDSPTDRWIINNNSKETTFIKVNNFCGEKAQTKGGVKSLR
ncbi:autotransporter outer membrane beta-barrel domain-containing protein [Candidatus Williamhamiltonella defendens]|uniref:autotransporter outer membrane beta-barrel domain-containing protein n=1 Tax=Candidatus Williamhamiltonella defendens TaxID=138072 RepID=UPI00130EDB8D|nr:autotransporter outer membrane beta-barrel domain-containing protein [Candidatus Hamiltonella defensa]